MKVAATLTACDILLISSAHIPCQGDIYHAAYPYVELHVRSPRVPEQGHSFDIQFRHLQQTLFVSSQVRLLAWDHD